MKPRARRAGPVAVKFRYDMQIESQPDAVEAVLRRPVPRLDSSRPLLFCGQGTSLHAARVAAAWAGYPALAVESHDAALRTAVPPGAQVVVVSHSGGGFTPAVLRKARRPEQPRSRSAAMRRPPTPITSSAPALRRERRRTP